MSDGCRAWSAGAMGRDGVAGGGSGQLCMGGVEVAACMLLHVPREVRSRILLWSRATLLLSESKALSGFTNSCC